MPSRGGSTRVRRTTEVRYEIVLRLKEGLPTVLSAAPLFQWRQVHEIGTFQIMGRYRRNSPSASALLFAACFLVMPGATLSLFCGTSQAAGIDGSRPTSPTPRLELAPPNLSDSDAWIRQGLAHNAAGRYQEALEDF